MPLDALGRTRATLVRATSAVPYPFGIGNLLKAYRGGNRLLQLPILNKEFLVSVGYHLGLITSLPFVHTARRSYRLIEPVRVADRPLIRGTLLRVEK